MTPTRASFSIQTSGRTSWSAHLSNMNCWLHAATMSAGSSQWEWLRSERVRSTMVSQSNSPASRARLMMSPSGAGGVR